MNYDTPRDGDAERLEGLREWWRDRPLPLRDMNGIEIEHPERFLLRQIAIRDATRRFLLRLLDTRDAALRERDEKLAELELCKAELICSAESLCSEWDRLGFMASRLSEALARKYASRPEPRDAALREKDAEIERLREGLETIAGAIEGCSDAPRNPDSLPQMVLYEARRVLALAARSPETKP